VRPNGGLQVVPISAGSVLLKAQSETSRFKVSA
jgi:hypothetical protein